jgi:uncharacterized protein involved in type VI secretion and phage assembly
MSYEASFDAGRIPGESSSAPYSFVAFPFPPSHFTVHRVHGREALNRPYAFDLTLSSNTLVGEDLERLAVGQRAALLLDVGGPPRVIPGVVERVRSDGVQDRRGGKDTAMFTMRLVPALALLRHQRGSRIFQDVSVPEVVQQVLGEARIANEWNLTRRYASRPYITQYEESDLAFIQRLLAEAGIFYFFATPGSDVVTNLTAAFAASGGSIGDVAGMAAAAVSLSLPEETVLFVDDAAMYPVSVSTAPMLRFLDGRSGAEDGSDKVLELAPTRRVRSEVAEYRDFDPSRPGGPRVSRWPPDAPGIGVPDVSVAASVSTDAAALNLNASASLGLGGVADALLRLVGQRQLETYEHHGNFLFPEWDDADQTALLIRRQTTRNRVAARGASLAPSLAAGHRFKLEGHPIHDHNREYVVVTVEHTGRVGEKADLYRNTFTTVPGEVPFPPRRPKRKTVQSMLTATVVGPPGEEIHVDAAGRIKVLFHWDRRGIRDDRASCWIRSVQPWGGAGYGHQFIPRVGMEVAVSFEGGDPDKPIVIGSLYNATHVPSFALPAHKTRSGIRTQSSPGGGGFNELSFEDQTGREQVYLHAQRDLDELVERNHTLLTRGDERLRVIGDRLDVVEHDAVTRVGRDAKEHVARNQSVLVEGDRVDVVSGSSDTRVSGALTTRVEGTEHRHVQQSAELEHAADLTTRVRGCMTTLVGKADANRSWVTHAEGIARLSSSRATEVESEEAIVLRVGKSWIRISSEQIEIQSPSVVVAGQAASVSASADGLRLSSQSDAQLLVKRKIVLKSKDGASLAMQRECKVDAQQILLNSPEQASDPPPKEPDPPTTIELVDETGRPLAYERFVITLDGGAQLSGVTDKDGKKELAFGGSGTISFPDASDAKAG